VARNGIGVGSCLSAGCCFAVYVLCLEGRTGYRTQGIEGKYVPAGSAVCDPAVTFFFSMSFVLTSAFIVCDCQLVPIVACNSDTNMFGFQ